MWIPYDVAAAEEVKEFTPIGNFMAQMIVLTRKQNLTWSNLETKDMLRWQEGVKPIYKYYNHPKIY